MWFKSSYSNPSGNCVEIAFTKSSACASGECVEVGQSPSEILVRDSKHPAGPTLSFTPAEWDAFIKGAKNNEFDLK